VSEREPPACQDEPDQIADQAQRAGADIALARELVAPNRARSERQQGVDGDIEGGPRPGQADNGDRHDDRSDEPAERHHGAAEENPEHVQKDGYRSMR